MYTYIQRIGFRGTAVTQAAPVMRCIRYIDYRVGGILVHCTLFVQPYIALSCSQFVGTLTCATHARHRKRGRINNNINRIRKNINAKRTKPRKYVQIYTVHEKTSLEDVYKRVSLWWQWLRAGQSESAERLPESMSCAQPRARVVLLSHRDDVLGCPRVTPGRRPRVPTCQSPAPHPGGHS